MALGEWLMTCSPWHVAYSQWLLPRLSLFYHLLHILAEDPASEGALLFLYLFSLLSFFFSGNLCRALFINHKGTTLKRSRCQQRNFKFKDRLSFIRSCNISIYIGRVPDYIGYIKSKRDNCFSFSFRLNIIL